MLLLLLLMQMLGLGNQQVEMQIYAFTHLNNVKIMCTYESGRCSSSFLEALRHQHIISWNNETI